MKNFRPRLIAFIAGVLLGPAIVWAGLETGTYISELVATNPLGSDLASTLDDHIRLLKSTIKTTFPNINGAVSATDEELSLLSGKSGTVWTSVNDGSGSTLDADLLDGISSASFCQTTGGGCGANPTASLGLTAVNGSAATYMRSDGAPALSVSISPTWTGNHRFTGLTGTADVTTLEGTTPVLRWMETDAAANNGNWDFSAVGEQFGIYLNNDALNSFAAALTIDRTGVVVDNVALPTDAAAGIGGAFRVGTVNAAAGLANTLTQIRTATASQAAIVLRSVTSSVTTEQIQNEGTSGDNIFTSYYTEAGAGSPRGSVTYNRAGGLVAYNTSSADDLKLNVRPSKSARSVIDCVKVVSHDWKYNSGHMDYWVTAGTLNPCAPWAVSYQTTPEHDGNVDVALLVPAMIKYMQEQDSRIASLERNAARRH